MFWFLALGKEHILLYPLRSKLPEARMMAPGRGRTAAGIRHPGGSTMWFPLGFDVSRPQKTRLLSEPKILLLRWTG